MLIPAAEVREGDQLWLDAMERWYFVVGREQGGYEDVYFYLDDGPDDEALKVVFKRREQVIVIPQPTMQEMLRDA